MPCLLYAPPPWQSDPISMDVVKFEPGEIAPVYKLLERTPVPPSKREDFVKARLLLLRHLNLVVRDTVLPLISLSALRATAHGRALAEVRGLVFWHSKVAMWEQALEITQSPDSRKMDLTLYRRKAKQLIDRGLVDREGKKSLLAQAQEQMSKWNYSGKDLIGLMRTKRQLFDCVFAGEGGEDAGGLYREAMDNLASEAEEKSMPLTVPNPNKDNKVGEHHDRRLWAPLASDDTHARTPFPAQRRLLRFVGQLIGYTMRTSDGVFPLNLSSLAWKQLVGETITLADLKASDQLVVQNMEQFVDLAAHGHTRETYEYTFDDQTFTYSDCNGDNVAVVPGGRDKAVTYDDGPAFAAAVLRYRMHESDSAAAEVRRGLATIVPVDFLNLWTWQDMERMVAGDPNPDLERLKGRTQYEHGLSAEDPAVSCAATYRRSFLLATLLPPSPVSVIDNHTPTHLVVCACRRSRSCGTAWRPSARRTAASSCCSCGGAHDCLQATHGTRAASGLPPRAARATRTTTSRTRTRASSRSIYRGGRTRSKLARSCSSPSPTAAPSTPTAAPPRRARWRSARASPTQTTRRNDL